MAVIDAKGNHHDPGGEGGGQFIPKGAASAAAASTAAKKFDSKGEAVLAAKKALGAKANLGQDFDITETADGYHTWTEGKAQPKPLPKPLPEAAPKPNGLTENLDDLDPDEVAAFSDEFGEEIGFSDTDAKFRDIGDLDRDQLLEFADTVNGGEPNGAEEDAIETYTGDGYESMNGRLRGSAFDPDYADPEFEEATQTHITNLDSFIERGRLPHNTVLYRGIRGGGSTADKLAAMQPGDTLTDRGFMSTTVDDSVTEAFLTRSHGHTGTAPAAKMVIRAPEGSKAAVLGPYSGMSDTEDEVLLPRGTTLKLARRQRLPSHDVLIFDLAA